MQKRAAGQCDEFRSRKRAARYVCGIALWHAMVSRTIHCFCCNNWWTRLGSNQRPLRCQRSALPLSYASARRVWAYTAPRGPCRRPAKARARVARSGGGGHHLLHLGDDLAQVDGLGEHLGARRARGRAAERATAAKPVMNMMRRAGWRWAAMRATSMPSMPGMTMSVSSRSNSPSSAATASSPSAQDGHLVAGAFQGAGEEAAQGVVVFGEQDSRHELGRGAS